MRTFIKYMILWTICLATCSLTGMLLANPASPSPDSLPVITSEDLKTDHQLFWYIRREYPGVALNQKGQVRWINDDNPLYASPEFDDSHWRKLESPDQSQFEIDKVHWCRASFRVHPSVKRQPLSLYVFWQGAMEIYLNGHLLQSFGAFNDPATGQTIRDAKYMPVRRATIILPDSTDTDVLAFRFGIHSNLIGAIGWDISSPPSMDIFLNEQQHDEAIEFAGLNDALLYGIFAGANLIMAMLTLFQARRKKTFRTQLYFGLFAFFTGIVALQNIGEKGIISLSTDAVAINSPVNTFAYCLSTYFLLLVMSSLFDKDRKIMPWLYTAFTIICMAAYYFNSAGVVDLNFPIFLLNLLSLIELMRLTWHSISSHAHGGWIIVLGALSFILGGTVLESYFSSFGEGLRPFWATMVIRSTFYLAMPTALSVFIAMQTTRNNRLLQRQRDELDQEVLERTRELRAEKKKSDDLLLNILPDEVAEELKEKGSADAKQIDHVTVMFTDFKGFTQISEKLTPKELVDEIHTCFKAFDEIIARHNIEKIKTIGDSYMCAGGLPVPNSTHALDIVNAAREIQQFMMEHAQERRTKGKEVFEIRIGIHTGPVVAGIVGIKKFAYDIWGDTVNIASRMESSGEPGKVNISGATYELVKDKFRCTPRGKVQAKNKGEIEMYFVEGRM